MQFLTRATKLARFDFSGSIFNIKIHFITCNTFDYVNLAYIRHKDFFFESLHAEIRSFLVLNLQFYRKGLIFIYEVKSYLF